MMEHLRSRIYKQSEQEKIAFSEEHLMSGKTINIVDYKP